MEEVIREEGGLRVQPFIPKSVKDEPSEDNIVEIRIEDIQSDDDDSSEDDSMTENMGSYWSCRESALDEEQEEKTDSDSDCAIVATWEETRNCDIDPPISKTLKTVPEDLIINYDNNCTKTIIINERTDSFIPELDKKIILEGNENSGQSLLFSLLNTKPFKVVTQLNNSSRPNNQLEREKIFKNPIEEHAVTKELVRAEQNDSIEEESTKNSLLFKLLTAKEKDLKNLKSRHRNIDLGKSIQESNINANSTSSNRSSMLFSLLSNEKNSPMSNHLELAPKTQVKQINMDYISIPSQTTNVNFDSNVRNSKLTKEKQNKSFLNTSLEVLDKINITDRNLAEQPRISNKQTQKVDLTQIKENVRLQSNKINTLDNWVKPKKAKNTTGESVSNCNNIKIIAHENKQILFGLNNKIGTNLEHSITSKKQGLKNLSESSLINAVVKNSILQSFSLLQNDQTPNSTNLRDNSTNSINQNQISHQIPKTNKNKEFINLPREDIIILDTDEESQETLTTGKNSFLQQNEPSFSIEENLGKQNRDISYPKNYPFESSIKQSENRAGNTDNFKCLLENNSVNNTVLAPVLSINGLSIMVPNSKMNDKDKVEGMGTQGKEDLWKKQLKYIREKKKKKSLKKTEQNILVSSSSSSSSEDDDDYLPLGNRKKKKCSSANRRSENGFDGKLNLAKKDIDMSKQAKKDVGLVSSSNNKVVWPVLLEREKNINMLALDPVRNQAEEKLANNFIKEVNSEFCSGSIVKSDDYKENRNNETLNKHIENVDSSTRFETSLIKSDRCTDHKIGISKCVDREKKIDMPKNKQEETQNKRKEIGEKMCINENSQSPLGVSSDDDDDDHCMTELTDENEAVERNPADLFRNIEGNDKISNNEQQGAKEVGETDIATNCNNIVNETHEQLLENGEIIDAMQKNLDSIQIIDTKELSAKDDQRNGTNVLEKDRVIVNPKQSVIDNTNSNFHDDQMNNLNKINQILEKRLNENSEGRETKEHEHSQENRKVTDQIQKDHTDTIDNSEQNDLGENEKSSKNQEVERSCINDEVSKYIRKKSCFVQQKENDPGQLTESSIKQSENSSGNGQSNSQCLLGNNSTNNMVLVPVLTYNGYINSKSNNTNKVEETKEQRKEDLWKKQLKHIREKKKGSLKKTEESILVTSSEDDDDYLPLRNRPVVNNRNSNFKVDEIRNKLGNINQLQERRLYDKSKGGKTKEPAITDEVQIDIHSSLNDNDTREGLYGEESEENREIHRIQENEISQSTEGREIHDDIQGPTTKKKGLGKKKKCPHCPMNFYSSYLKLHKLSQHTAEKDNKYFRCSHCDYKTLYKGNLSNHIINKHTNPESMMDRMKRCDKCPKMFKCLKNLQRHKTIHDKNRPIFRCGDCAFNCVSKLSFQLHVKDHKFPDKEYNCHLCDFKTKSRKKLLYHKSHVHRKSFYQCHICSHGTKNKEHFRLHLLNHKKVLDDNDYKYRCDKCDYKTYREYSFQVHNLNHLAPDEVQYFYCYHCNFKAKRKDNLKTHILKLHIKNTSKFQCIVCDFTTTKQAVLLRHIDKHAEDKQKQK